MGAASGGPQPRLACKAASLLSPGSMKGASACVESVFSGVKRLLGDFSATLSPEVLTWYVFIHYNWQYTFLRPTIDEIVKAYITCFGKEPVLEDADSEEDDNDEEDEEAEDE